MNSEGFPTYVNRSFHPDIITDFGIQVSTELENALSMISELSEVTIIDKYHSKKSKRKKSLKQLLEQEEVRKNIIKWVQSRLAKFLTFAIENNFTLCLNLNRKDWVAQKQILFSDTVLQPSLYFKKTTEGVIYNLRLFDNQSIKEIIGQNIYILTNDPAWVVFGDKLYQIAEINANLLKPFMTKNEVFIKQDFVKTYFQKFIIKIASKTNIETEGFEVRRFSELTRCDLRMTKDFMSNRYGFVVKFVYEKAIFDYKDAIQFKTELNLDDNEVTIFQYKRHAKVEKSLISKLGQLGLVNRVGKYFELASAENNGSEMYYWLIDNQTTLRQANFTIIPPEIDQKTLILQHPKLSLNLNQINDWFDLNGEILVGNFKIPFQKIVPYIKDEKRFYPLPDESHFYIPDEWFEKYQPVAKLAKIENDTVRLTKAQFTLLKNIDTKVTATSTNVVSDVYENMNYNGSEQICATLRPYQLDGVKWLINLQKNKLGGCLADDMGLGKTLQTISALQYAKEEKTKRTTTVQQSAQMQLSFFEELQATTNSVPLTALIIMPASLIFNWEAELRKFAPHLMVCKHIGSKRHKSERYLPTFDVILTTYGTALKDVKILQKVDFEYIVLDESQQIKNKDSKIFKAINTLKSHYKLSLSGTPIENSLSDLWSQMEFINPKLLGTYKFFREEFQIPIEKNNDEAKKERLKSLTEPYILRRTKMAVAKDLPPVTEQVFYAEMLPEQRKQYEKAKSKARNYLLDSDAQKQENYNTIVFSTLMKLRQLAIHPSLVEKEISTKSGKFQDITEQIDVLIKGGHKVLIFSNFVKHLELFEQHFLIEKYGFTKLTGSMTTKERESAVQEFQNNPHTHLFLISLKAGGTGLNLTAADYVFLTDPWWNPAAEQQAIARAHRIGQTKNVMVTRFITKNTIEEKILQLQQQKQQLAEDIIGNDDRISFNRKDLQFLLS